MNLTNRYAAGNSQFATMAGEQLRLNVFGKLKVRSSIEVYRLKTATAASWSDDAAKSASLLSQHRPGGFHRPMRSSATRTSHIKRFCTMPPLPKPSASSSGTAQSRRAVNCKPSEKPKSKHLL